MYPIGAWQPLVDLVVNPLEIVEGEIDSVLRSGRLILADLDGANRRADQRGAPRAGARRAVSEVETEKANRSRQPGVPRPVAAADPGRRSSAAFRRKRAPPASRTFRPDPQRAILRARWLTTVRARLAIPVKALVLVSSAPAAVLPEDRVVRYPGLWPGSVPVLPPTVPVASPAERTALPLVARVASPLVDLVQAVSVRALARTDRQAGKPPPAGTKTPARALEQQAKYSHSNYARHPHRRLRSSATVQYRGRRGTALWREGPGNSAVSVEIVSFVAFP